MNISSATHFSCENKVFCVSFFPFDLVVFGARWSEEDNKKKENSLLINPYIRIPYSATTLCSLLSAMI